MAYQASRNVALCAVTAQVGPVFTANRGFTSVVRNGAGDYTLTLDQPVDATESITKPAIRVAQAASAAIEIAAVRPDDSTIRVTTTQEAAIGGASVMADIAFSLEVDSLV